MSSDIIATAPPGYGSSHIPLGSLPGQHHSSGPVGNSAKPIVGPRPTEIKCPQCGARGSTSIEYRPSTRTHCLSIMLCWTACICCLPYFINSCRNAEHSCSSCGAYIGTYES